VSLSFRCIFRESLEISVMTFSLVFRARVIIVVARVSIRICACVSRSRPHHVTSNCKLGRDFQSRNESPFCLVHDGVALTRERAKGETTRSLVWRRGPSRYPRGESRREARGERNRELGWERADARARSNARKTWSGNTIDERSIARFAHPCHL